MSERFLVLGGRQRERAVTLEERRAFEAAVVLQVDRERGTKEVVHTHISPPEVLAADGLPRIVFKAATREADLLYTCTETEVLIYRLPGFEMVRRLSLPSFNDLHHVRPLANGNLLVVSTGLDMVLEVDPEDGIARCWNALGEEPWARFDRGTDYRRIASTKPHAAHPNYIFTAGSGSEVSGPDEIWVTRFEQRDAVSLEPAGKRIAIDIQRPHDGIVRGDRVYFTTVDGHVVIADLATTRVVKVVDLQAITDTPYALGWCRGLCVLDASRVVVGFSRLRPTRFGENVRWIKNRLGLRATPGDLPSRIACYDLEAGRLLWEETVEEAGLNVLFSIHPTDRDEG